MIAIMTKGLGDKEAGRLGDLGDKGIGSIEIEGVIAVKSVKLSLYFCPLYSKLYFGDGLEHG